MILGVYWLTQEVPGAKGEGKIFGSANEAIMASEFGTADLHAKVKVRMGRAGGEIIETTIGRIIFNLSLPKEIPFINKHM
jgi:DNA-directed RNA polymerase subunit beta'